MSKTVSAFALLLALTFAGDAFSQASAQAGQTRGGGPNADYGNDSHGDMRNAMKHENARQKAIRTPQNQPNDGGWGSNTRDISSKGANQVGGDSPNGAGRSNPNSANNGKGPGG